MSVRIGEVLGTPVTGDYGPIAVHVQASRVGVELHSDAHLTLEPTQARNFAALLVRGADEVEHMRAQSTDGSSGDQ